MSDLLLAKVYGQTLDYAIIIGYFVFILGFGTVFGRFSKSTRDFFFSGQRFSWWLIAMSMAATGIGSYSFLKYSLKGYEYGMSSSMTYMNDWFFQPFFMFGWLPIIYFSRVRSVPEYFERRFNTKARFMAVVVMLMYLMGYIGYNLFTVGKIAGKLLDVELLPAMAVVTVISAIYITFGGQTAVIFTDLAQGFMLFLAGFVVLFLGLSHLGQGEGVAAGLEVFWRYLTLGERLPFAPLNRPPDFNLAGVFWQDGVASSITFLFINQGLIMRFLAAKSMNEGRRTIFFNTLFILPLSMIVVGCGGWIGNVMAATGEITVPDAEKANVFVIVADIICRPGVFGFVLAALTAALMSTIDTLTNACAAVFIYDVYQPYVARGRNDRHYFRAARVATVCTSIIGFGVGYMFYKSDGDLYTMHARMISVVTPPIVVAVFLGAFWKGFTPAAAFGTMFLGIIFNLVALKYPQLVKPFTDLHNMEPVADSYRYMQSFAGLTACAVIGVVISLFTRPKPESEIAGLWIGSVNAGRRLFKGAEPNFNIGDRLVLRMQISDDGTAGPETHVPIPDAPHGQPEPAYPVVRFSHQDMERMKLHENDLVYVTDSRRWLGGLRSLHARAGVGHDQNGVLLLNEQTQHHGNLILERPVRTELIF